MYFCCQQKPVTDIVTEALLARDLNILAKNKVVWLLAFSYVVENSIIWVRNILPNLRLPLYSMKWSYSISTLLIKAELECTGTPKECL